MSRRSLSSDRFMFWWGRGDSIQNFNPSPRSDAVPGGGLVVVQRLWNDILFGRV